MIDTKLITFITLCETRNYTKTAELLYVTQPSVTNHIKTLEKMYDVRLFTSHSKNFDLTPQGELLYKYAMQLKAYDAQFERLLAASTNQKELITFSATPNIKSAFLKHVITKWTSNREDLNFCLNVDPYNKIMEDLNSGIIDFAIIDNNFNKKKYNSIPLHKTKLFLAVNKKHPLAKNIVISFDELIKERIILDISGTGKRDFLESELKSKNRSIKDLTEVIEINSPDTVIDMVLSSKIASIFYESEIEDYIKNGKLIPIDILEVKNDIQFNLIYNKNHLSSKLIEEIAIEFSKIYKENNFLKYTK